MAANIGIRKVRMRNQWMMMSMTVIAAIIAGTAAATTTVAPTTITAPTTIVAPTNTAAPTTTADTTAAAAPTATAEALTNAASAATDAPTPTTAATIAAHTTTAVTTTTTTDRDGGLSPWTSWSKCTVTCGVGQRTRERACDNPSRQGNGLNCTGDLSESQLCTAVACPIPDLETTHGVEMGLKGVTFDEFNETRDQFILTVVSETNDYCNMNQANSRLCCNNDNDYNTATALEFLASDGVYFSDGYPTIEYGVLRLVFVVKYDVNNTLCASGTTGRRKRALFLATHQHLLAQNTLLLVLEAQKAAIIAQYITQSRPILDKTLWITVVSLKGAGSTSPAPDDNPTVPPWVIIPVLLGSLLILILILVVMNIINKMKHDDKVKPLSEEEAQSPPADLRSLERLESNHSRQLNPSISRHKTKGRHSRVRTRSRKSSTSLAFTPTKDATA